METAPVNLDAQQLFEPDIAEAHRGSEVVEEGELAWLGGRFVSYDVQAELAGEPVRQGVVERAMIVEEAHALGALSGFDDEFEGAGVEPALSLFEQLVDGRGREGAGVFLAELELDIEAALAGHGHDFGCAQRHIGEAFAALDAGEADIGAERSEERRVGKECRSRW